MPEDIVPATLPPTREPKNSHYVPFIVRGGIQRLSLVVVFVVLSLLNVFCSISKRLGSQVKLQWLGTDPSSYAVT